ncbi:holin family protein [Ruegeria sp. ANG-R]|uniref:holin family protein n=1 Tax=Ruegeria sp. ANG-R TaxID=1577903 RepID=UPI000B2ADEE5|nr:holin family protein [Ruegeria sp. ANG-R]
MGMISNLLGLLFGGGRNVVRDTAEVFRENAEAAGQRSFEYDKEALAQFAAEFASVKTSRFDSFIDAINRIPRPLMALSVVFLFAAAMIDPVWFAARMQGLALVPEPLWWLMGVVVSFYFGARHQLKTQQFQKSIAETLSRAPVVVENIAALRGLNYDSPGVASTGADSDLTLQATRAEPGNAAISAWRSGETSQSKGTD